VGGEITGTGVAEQPARWLHIPAFDSFEHVFNHLKDFTKQLPALGHHMSKADGDFAYQKRGILGGVGNRRSVS